MLRAAAGGAPAPELECGGADLQHLRQLLASLASLVGELPQAVDRTVLALPAVPDVVLLSEIGRGGMGAVYRAFQLSTRRLVAVKVLLGGQFSDPVARWRFTREVELTARLRHPGVVDVLFGGQVEGRPFFVMEYVPGRPLHVYLRDLRPQRSEVLQLFILIAEAVGAAHRRGVLHRDLKPSNVVVDAAGRPHLMDFGMGKSLDGEDAALTEVGMVMGTLSYLSPEQACGLPLDHRTDLYSLGVMLYEALVGRSPYPDGEDPLTRMRRIARAEVQPPRVAEVGREAAAVLERALACRREERYPDAAAFVDDLRRLLEGSPVAARSGRIARLVRWARPWTRLAAVSLGAALLISWGAQAWRHRSELEGVRLRALTSMNAVELRRRPPGTGWLEDAVRLYPDLDDVQLVLAQAYLRDPENHEMGVRLLESALARSPVRWPLRMLLAEALPGRAGGALPADSSAEALYLASLATLDRELALQRALLAVQLDPRHALGWRRVAHLRQLAGDHGGCVTAIDRSQELEGDTVGLQLQRIDALVLAGRLEDALAAADAASRSARHGADWNRQRATVLRLLGRHAEALAEYARAIEAGGAATDPWDLYHRAGVQWILGRPEAALADYRAARERIGRTSFGDARSAVILAELGRTAEAQSVLEEALATPADDWLAAVLRCLLGELSPEALVASADPADPERFCEALYYAGEACLLARRCGDAWNYFEACVATGVTTDPDARPLRPMNEMDLAIWRLTSLPPPDGRPAAARPAVGAAR